MSDTLSPTTTDEVLDTVRAAIADEAPLQVLGRGTKAALGRPVAAPRTIQLSGLSGIAYYEPRELVLTAAAGTPLAEIEAALQAEGQHLPFEPCNLDRLLGGEPDAGTLGGAISANLSGPRRFYAGGARDHFLGFEAVSGRGEIFKSGGRVIKNVTGFDLSKLIAGSFGTLGIMTEVSLKVLPAPETTRTLLLPGDDLAAACQYLSAALKSPHAVNGAAHLPAAAAGRSTVGYVAGMRSGVTALRVEGHRPSVEARLAGLRTLFQDIDQTEELHSHNSAKLWREIGKGTLLTQNPESQVWRLSLPPTNAASAIGALSEQMDIEFSADWGGGLLWIAIPAQADAAQAAMFKATEQYGGHATLIRADETVRAAVPVFQPLSPPLMDITGRLKGNFDPHRILNPGKMYKDV
ncbi:MAG: glycolate oxidase subunit GlcE [Proteobacteria bacterium]|nr:glycolate oxidase subunit GlcE [Pseudomonadota bacterium]